MFALVYLSQYNNSKRRKDIRCDLPKGIFKNYNVIINENTIKTEYDLMILLCVDFMVLLLQN